MIIKPTTQRQTTTKVGFKTTRLNNLPMKQRQAKAHMRAAQVYADLSYCNRRKVGCVIVKNDRIISIGYNGTPPNADNTCEDEQGITKPDVIHAEHNAIKKLDLTTETGEGAVLFVTTAPCKACAERIHKFGIREVFYYDLYHNETGIEYLRSHGIAVQQLSQQ
jgi:dCMP deaminase